MKPVRILKSTFFYDISLNYQHCPRGKGAQVVISKEVQRWAGEHTVVSLICYSTGMIYKSAISHAENCEILILYFCKSYFAKIINSMVLPTCSVDF